MYLAINLLAQSIFSIIPGRRNDDDAPVDKAADGATDRIILVRFDRPRAEAHVHHLDVVDAAIRDYPVKRAQHRGRSARAICAEHSQFDQICVGSDTQIFRVRDTSVARGNGRDMGAVAVGIVCASFSGKIPIDDDAPQIDLIGERYVSGINSLIKHGNSNT